MIMKQWKMLTAVLAVGFVCFGCGKSQSSQVNARASEPKQVAKWKYTPTSIVGVPRGLVIETQGDTILSATMYDLKDGPGFELEKAVSSGHLLNQQGKLLLAIAKPVTVSVENWIASGGIYWEVLYSRAATNLVARLKVPGVPEVPDEFLPVRE